MRREEGDLTAQGNQDRDMGELLGGMAISDMLLCYHRNTRHTISAKLHEKTDADEWRGVRPRVMNTSGNQFEWKHFQSVRKFVTKW
jgi:hypothetical protein